MNIEQARLFLHENLQDYLNTHKPITDSTNFRKDLHMDEFEIGELLIKLIRTSGYEDMHLDILSETVADVLYNINEYLNRI